MITALLIANLILDVITLITIGMLFRTKFLTIYLDNKSITPSELKKMSKSGIRVEVEPKKRGAIFVPPSDIDIERERIIEERRAQGLDTPIDMLRERTNDE